ncbi:MAG: Asp-tRNA(Asn)/Glu-tRNA(Gln) amidotransferase subunit GatC [Elusimicrobia bacterium]|nr:Asp-tRNA(Asn)/Glu-tRNA(Gln) amidotransferase subunit GatC [Elusimicrobiota bacterium]
MSVSIKEVERIAKLMRLRLSEKEKELFAVQIGAMLDSIKKLDEADVSCVRLDGENLTLPLREDNPAQFLQREEILSNLPLREYDFAKVKKILQ